MSRRRPRSDTLAASLAEIQAESTLPPKRRIQSVADGDVLRDRITVEADLARQELQEYKRELAAELQKQEEREQDDELMGNVDDILSRLQSPSRARQRRRKKPPSARSRTPPPKLKGTSIYDFPEDIEKPPTIEERINELTYAGESNEDARARIQREVQEIYEHLIAVVPDFRTGETN